MIRRAYSSACSWSLESLLAEALSDIICLDNKKIINYQLLPLNIQASSVFLFLKNKNSK